MARARNIKPGFFENEVLVELPFEYRLLFIGIWTLCDREGRMEDRPTRVKMKLFPGDSVDVESGLQALHNKGFIQRYEAEGCKYIQVLTWAKHQNPHCKESASTIPAPCKHGTSTADSLIPDSLIPDSNTCDAKASAERPSAKPKGEKCPQQEIIAVYHEELPELPPINEWPDASAQQLRARWKSLPERKSVEWWRDFFRYIKTSDFLMGRKTDFQASLSWIVKASNFAKIVNGNYENRGQP